MRPDPNNPPKDEAELAELLFAPSTHTSRLEQVFRKPKNHDENVARAFGLGGDDSDNDEGT